MPLSKCISVMCIATEMLEICGLAVLHHWASVTPVVICRDAYAMIRRAWGNCACVSLDSSELCVCV